MFLNCASIYLLRERVYFVVFCWNLLIWSFGGRTGVLFNEFEPEDDPWCPVGLFKYLTCRNVVLSELGSLRVFVEALFVLWRFCFGIGKLVENTYPQERKKGIKESERGKGKK